MSYRHTSPGELDPRRTPRHARRRDFMSTTKSVSIPRLPELLASLLVRLGWIR